MSRRAHMALRILACAAAAAVMVFLYFSQETPDSYEPVSPVIASAPMAKPVAGIIDLPALFPEMPAGAVADPIAEGSQEEFDGLKLIGIAGRLPDDVEVLLRLPDGSSVSLEPGENVLGYTLKSVAADRAVFIKDGREMMLTIPKIS